MTLILNRRALICLQRYNKGKILTKTHNIDYFAGYGHLSLIYLLHNNSNVKCTTYAMEYAAYNNHLDIVKFLHHNRTEGCTTGAIDWTSHHKMVI
jgi:hypothetical protein